MSGPPATLPDNDPRRVMYFPAHRHRLDRRVAMPLTDDEITTLADTRYDGDEYEHQAEKLFAMLVDVADVYVRALEDQAADHPAPFLGGTTPIQASILGLEENLHMRRDPTWGRGL